MKLSALRKAECSALDDDAERGFSPSKNWFFDNLRASGNHFPEAPLFAHCVAMALFMADTMP